jgi:hypothetical protein
MMAVTVPPTRRRGLTAAQLGPPKPRAGRTCAKRGVSPDSSKNVGIHRIVPADTEHYSWAKPSRESMAELPGACPSVSVTPHSHYCLGLIIHTLRVTASSGARSSRAVPSWRLPAIDALVVTFVHKSVEIQLPHGQLHPREIRR